MLQAQQRRNAIGRRNSVEMPLVCCRRNNVAALDRLLQVVMVCGCVEGGVWGEAAFYSVAEQGYAIGR